MRPERRHAQRRRLGGVSYFQFETGNGGIVLDASEEGLGFQAADTIQQLGPNRICISPHPEEQIELKGDVVWMDTSKKAGGLRFLEPGAEAYKRVHEWLKQVSPSEVSRRWEEVPLPGWATRELSNIPSKADHQSAGALRAIAAPPPAVPPREERPAATSKPASVFPPFFGPDLISPPHHSGAWPGGSAKSIASGFLICAFSLALIVALREFRPEIGNSLIHLGEKLSENTSLPPQSSASMREPAPSRVTTSPAAEPNGDPHSQPNIGMPTSLPTSSAADNSQVGDTAGSVPGESAGHPVDRQAPYYSGDKSSHAQELWSAVEAGDSSAEVELARLYMKGEGVPRNCEQARVLLSAAAKGRNLEARYLLRRVRLTGCR